MSLIPLLFAAHLLGDFILQNHWMQAKSRDSLVCAVHVCVYMLAFTFLLPPYAFALVLLEHFFQDRFALHLKWMKLFRQTTSDLWPVGPMCVDQAFHLTFLALIGTLVEKGVL